MIRSLHPLDAARYAFFGAPGRSNRAYTLENLGSEIQPRLPIMEAARLSLSSQGKGVCALAWINGNQVMGIVAARQRSGPRTWEVSHLVLGSDYDRGCVDLLKRTCQEVARKGGERVFIRLIADDPLVEEARMCGFVPCLRELRYRGRRRLTPNTRPMSVRRKGPPDEYSLFQLYTASTPSQTRLMVGTTFGQWASSRERSRGRHREYVYERDGVVRGWIRTNQRFGAAQLTMMIHPDEETSISALLDHGLTRLTRTNTVYCMVPDHQTLLERVLLQRGYEVVSEHVTLARSMVAPAKTEETRKGITAATAWPGSPIVLAEPSGPAEAEIGRHISSVRNSRTD